MKGEFRILMLVNNNHFDLQKIRFLPFFDRKSSM
jgi:hypothetical protein